MKVEVRCPDCTHAWLVDERSRRGEMICPQCMARVALGPAAEPAAAPAARSGPPAAAVVSASTNLRAAPPSGGGGRRSTGTTALAPPPPEAAATRAAIVCPRCQLHFQLNPQAVAPAPGVRKKVLIIEDLEYFRQIAADALGPTFEVATAKTSDEARAILTVSTFDLIVLDLTLDGRDGGRRLLTELTPKPCPILIFTAQDESEMYGEYWDELTRLGADDLVIKGMKVSEALARKAAELVGSPLDED